VYKLSRMLVALAVFLSGLALVPYVALPSEHLQWQMFAGAYQPESYTQVKIRDFAFTPDVVLIETGAVVRWTNDDGVPHTVTSDSGIFGSNTLLSGEHFEYRFDAPGTYTYHCSFHPSMTGKIIVVEDIQQIFLPLVVR
jgi:plastocyanin